MTHYSGHITITPPLNDDERSFLANFAQMRHMDRANGPLYIAPTVHVDFGQRRDEDIRDFNQPNPDHPGLWCQWTPGPTGAHLEWSNTEPFHFPAEWMRYLIDCLLSEKAVLYVETHKSEDERLDSFTCDHTLNGVIHVREAYGDDHGWTLVVNDNVCLIALPEESV